MNKEIIKADVMFGADITNCAISSPPVSIDGTTLNGENDPAGPAKDP
jgi:hypothetical protein